VSLLKNPAVGPGRATNCDRMGSLVALTGRRISPLVPAEAILAAPEADQPSNPQEPDMPIAPERRGRVGVVGAPVPKAAVPDFGGGT